MDRFRCFNALRIVSMDAQGVNIHLDPFTMNARYAFFFHHPGCPVRYLLMVFEDGLLMLAGQELSVVGVIPIRKSLEGKPYTLLSAYRFQFLRPFCSKG